MEYRDVKLRVELDVAGAVPGVPLPGRGGSGAGAGGGGGRGRRGALSVTDPAAFLLSGEDGLDVSTDTSDMGVSEEYRRRKRSDALLRKLDKIESNIPGPEETDASETILNAAKWTKKWGGAAIGGGLFDRLMNAAGPLGAGFLLAADYGPGAVAAARELMPEGPMRDATGQYLSGVEEAARKINEVRAASTALSVAFEATREAASTEMIMTGRSDPAFLRRFAAGQWVIGQTILDAERNRKTLGMEGAGGALGVQVKDLIQKALQAGLLIGTVR